MKDKVILPKTIIADIDNIFELNKFERANVIKKYMNKNLETTNNLAKKFNVKRSIICDWLRWNNILETEYEIMLNEGYNEDKIKTILQYKYESKDIMENYFLIQIKGMLETLSKLKRNIDINQHTTDEVLKLRNEINYLLYKIEHKK